MKILILGYNSKKTKIFKFIKKYKKSSIISHTTKKVNYFFLNKFDLIISFGYRHILKKKDIYKLKRTIINLHMSYLPYNRGAHPNFWSFIEKTPSGVSIHEVDEGIDTGEIIFQKKIKFAIKKNTKLNFKHTYQFLFDEIEKLFFKNISKILKGNYRSKKQKNYGTLHFKKNLPVSIIKNWNQSIAKTVDKYNNIR